MAQIMGMESDGLTFDQMKSFVATTAAARGWLVFAGHEIGSPRRQTTQAAALEELIQYAAEPSNGVWLDTVATVAKYVQAQRGGR
jgi:hypothetical protein